jgi:DNA repair protein SbcD/Mre11
MSSAAKYIVMAEDQVEQPSYMVQDDVVTVVLTADNHLGYAAFGQQPRKREELQQRLRRAFQQATDFAVGQGVDLFVQAGDLFDTAVPDERERSFVATRLAQLRQAGVRTFGVGGVHDSPAETAGGRDEAVLAPQMSYARLGALHYFAPSSRGLEPVVFKVRNVMVGICGLGVVAGQVGNPLTQVRVQSDIERATIPLLLLHAPIEGVTSGSLLLDSRAQVSRASVEQQSSFRYILAGYDHSYHHVRIGHSEVIVAGATQHIDFRCPEQKPGFVFLGLAADGIRWSTHIPVDTLTMQRLLISVQDLCLNETAMEQTNPTEAILTQLSPLCNEQTMVQLRLVGKLTRNQYHQLDLNCLRRYGEQHCFALAIDDSDLEIVSADISGSKVETQVSSHQIERPSPREELMALADEWIAESLDEQEKQALCATKEDLLVAFDEIA